MSPTQGPADGYIYKSQVYRYGLVASFPSYCVPEDCDGEIPLTSDRAEVYLEFDLPADRFSGDKWHSLADVVSQLGDALTHIPESARSSAEIYFSSDWEYEGGSHFDGYSVRYRQPESDDAYASRMELVAAVERHAVAVREQHRLFAEAQDRAEWERLRVKFGDGDAAT